MLEFLKRKYYIVQETSLLHSLQVDFNIPHDNFKATRPIRLKFGVLIFLISSYGLNKDLEFMSDILESVLILVTFSYFYRSSLQPSVRILIQTSTDPRDFVLKVSKESDEWFQSYRFRLTKIVAASSI